MQETYPEVDAIKSERWHGLTLSVVQGPSFLSPHYCAYVRFPFRPTLWEKGYNGILTYVPVHGGITYATQEPGRSTVYGFDCAHAGDDERPELRDVDWLLAECRRMAIGIIVAALFEPPYIVTRGRGRAVVLDAYHWLLSKLGIKFELTDNFGSMINALCGRL